MQDSDSMNGEEDTAEKAQANVFPFGQLDKVKIFILQYPQPKEISG